MSTRNSRCGFTFLELPSELQVACLSQASDAASLCGAFASCKGLYALRAHAWESFCSRRWPEAAVIAAKAIEGTKSEANLAEYWAHIVHTALLMDMATEATINPAKSFSAAVTLERRTILVEWLIEVAYEWGLDGTTVFLAVRLLDSFLAANVMSSVKKLQLVGVCCLRAAMQLEYAEKEYVEKAQNITMAKKMDTEPRAAAGGAFPIAATNAHVAADLPSGTSRSVASSHPSPLGSSSTNGSDISTRVLDPAKDRLAARHFADICVDTYTIKQVDAMTDRIKTHILETHGCSRSWRTAAAAPTARHFLRSLWAAVEGTQGVGFDSVVPSELRSLALHLAGFLLHLSLVCPVACAMPPAHAAVGAFSMALETLGLDPWPTVMGGVLPVDLGSDVRVRITAVHQNQGVPNLREVWSRKLAIDTISRAIKKGSAKGSGVVSAGSGAGGGCRRAGGNSGGDTGAGSGAVAAAAAAGGLMPEEVVIETARVMLCIKERNPLVAAGLKAAC